MVSELVNRDLSGMLSLANVAAALGVGVLVGLVVSIYPAWVAFRVRPAQVLAGRPDTESLPARRLRQALSVLQVAAAMGIASFTLAVAWQTRFAINGSPGFDPAPLLVFEMNEGRKLEEDDTTRGLVAELGQHPAVAGVAIAADAIGRTRHTWSQELKRDGGRPVTISRRERSRRRSSRSTASGLSPAGCLIRRSTNTTPRCRSCSTNWPRARSGSYRRSRQWAASCSQRSPLSAEETPVRVIGIAPDIRLRSLREPPTAVVYNLWSAGMTVTVRARGSVADAATAVREVWPKYFPLTVLDMQPAKDIYAANYADDASLARLLTLATIVAMFIAAIGAYVLATDAVQRRTREIALRKLFGARRRDVGRLVAKEIGAVIVLAAIIALPLAALAIARYLAPFSERTPMAYWALGVALIAALGVVGVAAARQAGIAMGMKPAAALRT